MTLGRPRAQRAGQEVRCGEDVADVKPGLVRPGEGPGSGQCVLGALRAVQRRQDAAIDGPPGAVGGRRPARPCQQHGDAGTREQLVGHRSQARAVRTPVALLAEDHDVVVLIHGATRDDLGGPAVDYLHLHGSHLGR